VYSRHHVLCSFVCKFLAIDSKEIDRFSNSNIMMIERGRSLNWIDLVRDSDMKPPDPFVYAVELPQSNFNTVI
jgi:hypothetical protein